jgi:ADP-ribose pyrophosphatase YjhB (NUDIX family)
MTFMSLVYIGGCYIIKDDRVLFIQQTHDGPWPDLWGPPGGHGDPGEKPIDIAIRETKEETNLDVEILGITKVFTVENDGKEYLMIFYNAKAKNPNDIKLEENEAQACVWASLEDLKDNKYPTRQGFLRQFGIEALTKDPSRVDAFDVLPGFD